MNTAKVKFKGVGNIHDYEFENIDLKLRDRVVIDMEQGLTVGTVIQIKENIENAKQLKKILRTMNEEDTERERLISDKEAHGFTFCLERVEKRTIPMKLIDVEFYPNGTKAIFYFTADGRVDFRELVKDLAREFRTRIQMRQIGIRDGARMVGGIGTCGRELCCSSFLRDFATVSIKTAKDQNMALNPTKVSGVCGRLMCCLTYEHGTYLELGKDLPRIGKRVMYNNQPCRVKNVNFLKRDIIIQMEDDTFKTVKPEEITIPKHDRVDEYEEVTIDDELKKLEDKREEYKDDDFQYGSD